MKKFLNGFSVFMQVRCLNPTHTAIAAFLGGGFLVGMAFMISNLSFVML